MDDFADGDLMKAVGDEGYILYDDGDQLIFRPIDGEGEYRDGVIEVSREDAVGLVDVLAKWLVEPTEDEILYQREYYVVMAKDRGIYFSALFEGCLVDGEFMVLATEVARLVEVLRGWVSASAPA